MVNDKLFLDGYELPKPLSKEETYSLIKEVNAGSKEAKEKLIICNIRLVLYEVLNKFQNLDYDKKDLVSIGNIGLLKAVNTYDITKGYEFTTYAIRCIDNEILMFIRKLKNDKKVDSLDRVIYQDKDGSVVKLEAGIMDDIDFVEDYEIDEMRKIIRNLVNQLPDRNKEMVMLYFGFYDDIIYSQKEIARMFHISKSYVSKIISRIVQKIEKQLVEKGIIEGCVEVDKKDKVKKRQK